MKGRRKIETGRKRNGLEGEGEDGRRTKVGEERESDRVVGRERLVHMLCKLPPGKRAREGGSGRGGLARSLYLFAVCRCLYAPPACVLRGLKRAGRSAGGGAEAVDGEAGGGGRWGWRVPSPCLSPLPSPREELRKEGERGRGSDASPGEEE